MKKKKRVLAGLTPSGHLTIGNYFGSLKPLVNFLNNDFEVFIFVANLHGLSIPNNITPFEIRRNTIELLLVLKAMGLHNGKENCYVYFQSDFPSISLLGFLIQFFSNVGELEIMTQYKTKQKKLKLQNDTLYRPTGLLTYPTLMAADILLFSPDYIAVGEDQKQHIELTKRLCKRMNSYLKQDLLKIPEYKASKNGARIKSLIDPNKKMSKSDSNKNGSIYLLDNELEITQKIIKAKTDSKNKIDKNYQTQQKGVNNLLNLYTLSTNNKNLVEIINEINNEQVPYKVLKEKTINALIKETKNIREVIKNYLSSEISIKAFEEYIKSNPKFVPSFIYGKNYLTKKEKIKKEGNLLLEKILINLGLKI